MSHLQLTNPQANETNLFIDDARPPNPLALPNPSFMQERYSAADSNLDSSGHTPSHHSSSLNPLQPSRDDVAFLDGKREVDRTPYDKAPNRSRRLRLLLILFVLLIVAVGIALGAYFGVTRSKKSSNNSSSSASPSAASPTPGHAGQPNSKIVYGGDGTIVTTEAGTKFVYNNSFGGYFAVDPDNPFNNNARAQSWSPPLNQSWQFGKDQILGWVDLFFGFRSLLIVLTYPVVSTLGAGLC
jgi:glucan 1,3-beta-glucosidase